MNHQAEVSSDFDYVLVGSGPLMLLEAIHLDAQGSTVLIVDEQAQIGGAWRSLMIHGFADVENGVHYLTPNSVAMRFLEDVLGVPVAVVKGKYRYLSIAGRLVRVPYDSPISKALTSVLEGRSILNVAKDVVYNRAIFSPSMYFTGGSPSLLLQLESLVKASGVKIVFSTRIHAASYHGNGTVEVDLGHRSLLTKRLVISHGTKIPSYSGARGKVQIEELDLRRPAAHIIVSRRSSLGITECIFTKDRIVKYVHDVTRFSHPTSAMTPGFCVLTAAFQPMVEPSPQVLKYAIDLLTRAGLLTNESEVQETIWHDINLPTLSDAHLSQISQEFEGTITCLLTENFSRGISMYADRWASTLGSRHTSLNHGRYGKV